MCVCVTEISRLGFFYNDEQRESRDTKKSQLTRVHKESFYFFTSLGLNPIGLQKTIKTYRD